MESPEEVRDRLVEAASYVPVSHLGTTDDCGFSPFAYDTSTSRDVAFEKIRARIEGTRLAEEKLGAWILTGGDAGIRTREGVLPP